MLAHAGEWHPYQGRAAAVQRRTHDSREDLPNARDSQLTGFLGQTEYGG